MKFFIILLFCFSALLSYGQASHLKPFEKKGKYGLQTATGQVVVDAQFDLNPVLCGGGYWIVAKGGIIKKSKGGLVSYTGGQWALLDSTATRYIIDFQPNEISEYLTSGYYFQITGRPSLGLFMIKTPDGKYGIINKTGKEILPPVCGFIKEGMRMNYASYGFILYSINGKYGIVTLNGEEILPPEMDCISGIKNGHLKCAALQKNGKCGLFFNDGSVIPPIYDIIYSYYFGEKIKREKLVRYDPDGCESVFPSWYVDLILAIDSAKGKEVWMTPSGVEIDATVTATPRVIHDVHGKYIIIEENGKWGVYSIIDKRFTIPFIYDKIEATPLTEPPTPCLLFTVKSGDKYFWVDANNQRFNTYEFEKEFVKKSGYTYNILVPIALCNGSCDTVYYIVDCKMDSASLKLYGPGKSSLEKELDALERDIKNSLQQLKQETCTCCNGTGKDKNTAKTYKTCFKCNGKGYTTWTQREWSSAYGNQYSRQSAVCDRCSGTGKEIDSEKSLPCPCCQGSGYKNY